MVLFGASAFMYSINRATAAPVNAHGFIGNGVGTTGKYLVSIGLGRDGYMYAMALNSESGKTEVYYYNTEATGKWVKMSAQLPDFTF